MSRILLIDDDQELCRLMNRLLTAEGFTVAQFHDGPSGLEAALHGGFDIILLDVMLPGMDGFAVLEHVRRQSAVPVLMLTARAEQPSRVRGLVAGADDYLPKPFDPLELVARIRAILRRSTMAPFDAHGPVSVHNIILDSRSRTVQQGNIPLELTTTEFDILEMLMRAAGKVVPRSAIGQRLYQREITHYDRSLEVHISNIRRKLGGEREYVKTVRGTGYMFIASDTTEP